MKKMPVQSSQLSPAIWANSWARLRAEQSAKPGAIAHLLVQEGLCCTVEWPSTDTGLQSVKPWVTQMSIFSPFSDNPFLCICLLSFSKIITSLHCLSLCVPKAHMSSPLPGKMKMFRCVVNSDDRLYKHELETESFRKVRQVVNPG